MSDMRFLVECMDCGALILETPVCVVPLEPLEQHLRGVHGDCPAGPTLGTLLPYFSIKATRDSGAERRGVR